MEHLTEIRWHGRGGQGAKTAALLLADIAFGIGKYVQGFPEYGPERMGAPITAYDRISDYEIRVHSNIYEPDFVVEVEDLIYLVEIKGEDRISDADVIAKKERAIRYCKAVSEWGKANGYKQWQYLFIPAGEIHSNFSFGQLASTMFL